MRIAPVYSVNFNYKKINKNQSKISPNLNALSFTSGYYAQGRLPEEILHNAIVQNDNEKIKALFNEDKFEFKREMCLKNQDNSNPVYLAAKTGNNEALEFMAQSAPEIFKKAAFDTGYERYSALKIAVQKNNKDALKIFYKYAPDEFKKDMLSDDSWGDNSPLAVAVEFNSMDSMKTLFELCPDEFITSVSNHKYGTTPVYIAAESDNTEAIQYMAKNAPEQFKKAVLIPRFGSKQTPVHIAAKNGNFNSIKLIKDCAKDEFKKTLTQKDKSWNNTPVMLAAENGYDNILLLMADFAGDEFKKALKLKDRSDNTPVYYIVSKSASNSLKVCSKYAPDETRETLFEYDERFSSPYQDAIIIDNPDIIDTIYSLAPESFKPLDENGKTTLSVRLASSYASKNTLRKIAQSYPDDFKKALMVKNEYGNNLVSTIASTGKKEALCIIKEFAPEEFNLSAHDRFYENRTLLYLVSKQGSKEAFDLIKNELDNDEYIKQLNEPDNYGSTPVNIAAANPDSSVLKTMIADNAVSVESQMTNSSPRMGTLVHSASKSNNPDNLKMLYCLSPDKFKQCIIVQDEFKKTPLHICARYARINSLKTIKELAPDEFFMAAKVKDCNSKLPVDLADRRETIDILCRIL